MGNDNKHKNMLMVSYCPICGRELFWAPHQPVNHPNADYLAFCLWCKKEFGVSVDK